MRAGFRGVFFALAMAAVATATGQEAPRATIEFGGTFYVSEVDRVAKLTAFYSVYSTQPRNHRGPSDLVRLRVVGGTAVRPEDYTWVPEFVHFDGMSGSHVKTFEVEVRPDELEESDETIELMMEPEWGNTTLFANPAWVVIVDASVGKVRFATTNLVASEAAGEVEGELVREGGTRGEIEVMVIPWYGFTPGGASRDDAEGTVSVKFADGQDRATFKLKLAQDSLVEGTED